MNARPLRSDEYDAWRERSERAYAADMVSGGLGEDEATAQAAEDYAALLPAGIQTPGHRLLVLEQSGERVGTLWFAEQDRRATKGLYLYDVEIDERHRGRGLGREAMTVLEQFAQEVEAEVIDLAVFGANTRALALYESCGYVVTMRLLRKRLELIRTR